MKKLILAASLFFALTAVAQQSAPDRIRQYRYDADGNITQIDTETYVYDSVDRVISGTISGRVRQYTYDAFGNRRKCDGYFNNAQSDCQYTAQILSPTNHIDGAVYDGPGNLTSYAGENYSYDAAGSMTSHGIAEYVYTADDERIATINGVQWKWTIRDGSNKVLREVTSTAAADGTHSNWQWTRDNVFRNTTLLAAVDPSGTRNYHTDHLGTPRVVSDTTGAIIGVHDYVPFGLEIVYDLDDLDHPSEPNPGRLKFTGHERDEDGLDYMHARYYSANFGRFFAIDPTWRSADTNTPQSWNRYAYVRNNPIVVADPDGRCPGKNCVFKPEKVEPIHVLFEAVRDAFTPSGGGGGGDVPARAVVTADGTAHAFGTGPSGQFNGTVQPTQNGYVATVKTTVNADLLDTTVVGREQSITTTAEVNKPARNTFTAETISDDDEYVTIGIDADVSVKLKAGFQVKRGVIKEALGKLGKVLTAISATVMEYTNPDPNE